MVGALFDLQGDGIPHDAVTVGYEAREALSRPFEVEVDFYTEALGFDVATCLRKAFLLTVTNEQHETRSFHGVVDRATFVRASGPRLYFRLRLRPALSALSHRKNSRIFQNESVKDIADTLFGEAGFADKVKWSLSGTCPPRDYVVQYRESELDFVSRLFEDLGIFYFFEHSPDGHTMVICDDDQSAFQAGDAGQVVFAMSHGLLGRADALDAFSRRRALRTSHTRVRDYDFEKPGVRVEAEQPGKDRFPAVYYEYPGGFTAKADAEQRAKVRLRELRRDADICRGESRAIGLRVGSPFVLEGSAEGFLDGEYVVTELVSRGKQNPENEHDNFACRNRFEGIVKGGLYAPPRTTRKPRIFGLQTAMVTGPDGEEQGIHTDKFGRIKVRFHWDRVGQHDDTSSCWLRVAQPNMGGTMILPRIGWEVSVAFLDGDPDRPLATARVYNAEKPPPSALPGAKASGQLKSMSSPGAGGHNEIGASDSGGSQGFNIHAQKDLNIKTGHDKREEVAVDEDHYVHTNLSSSVGTDETIQVVGDQSIDVGAVMSQKIGGSQSTTVGGNDTSNATSNYVEKVTANRACTIDGRQMVLQNAIKCTVTSDLTRQVGAVQLNASVGSISDNVLGAFNSHVGAATVILANGTFGETVGGPKTHVCAAAEIHVVKGGYTMTCDQGVQNLIGGLHYQKITGDYIVKAPMITLVGAVGSFKGGSSTFKLGGGPIVIKGSTVAMEAAMIVKMGSSLKMGA